MTTSLRLPWAVAALVATALAVPVAALVEPASVASASPAGPTSTTVPASSSSAVPSTTVAGQRQAADQQVDVLTASRDDVRARVAGIGARIEAENARMQAAEQAFQQSMQQVAAARDAAAVARAAEAAARKQVHDYAVEAFIRPPSQDALSVLSISQVQEAGYASDVLQIVADQRRQVVGVFVAASEQADRRRSEAQESAADARSKADAAQAQVRSLEATRSQQVQLASDLDGRLDSALSEAAALKAVDAKAAKDLADQEVALRASVQLPSAPQAPSVAAAQVTAPATGPARPATPTTRPPAATPTTRPPATPTTRPPVTQPPVVTAPPGLPGWSDMTRVGGIWVNKRIAGQVRALLDAATAAGISLSGGGFRDPASQIALRQAHCGTSAYAIYQMPASQCSPPTARPGTSMHEQGLAIDFTSSGRLISTRSDRAFVWLSANAARFGFYNLPSEPWHWSVNGN